MWRRPACSLCNLISQFQIAGQMYSERSDYSIPTHSVRSFLQTTCFSGIRFEHFSGVLRPLSMLSFCTLFSTLLTYVGFGLAAIICCMPICYMLVWS